MVLWVQGIGNLASAGLSSDALRGRGGDLIEGPLNRVVLFLAIHMLLERQFRRRLQQCNRP